MIMRNIFRQFILIIVICLIFSGLSIAKTTLKIGKTPPNIQLKTITNENFELYKVLGKKVIILTYFTSWCNSCKESLAFLNDIQEKYGEKNIKVIGISLDKKTNQLDNFIKANKLKLEIIRDKKLKTLNDYRILIIPTTFLIDRDGKLQNIFVDFDKNIAENLEKDLKILLK